MRAGDFHYGEKEMLRRNPDTAWHQRLIFFCYKVLNGYGENWKRPLLWALGLFLLGAWGYHEVGLVQDCKHAPTLENIKKEQLDIIHTWADSLFFSAKTMFFIRSGTLQPADWGRWIH